MERNFRTARACAVEAVRDFNWREYAPFGWILAAHILFLLLALIPGTWIGMATAGGLSRLLHGDVSLHYPAFYLYLAAVSAVFEAFLYSVVGAALIPLALIRVLAPMDPSLGAREGAAARLRQAWLPTLVAFLVNYGVLTLWQWTLQQGPAEILLKMVPGAMGNAVVWIVSLIVGYIIAAFFIYVPIVAIQSGATFRASMRTGMREGVRLLWYTFLFILVFALPILPVLFVIQLYPIFIVQNLRPELIAVGLMLYAVLISLASYLTYAAAARLHWAAHREEA